MVAAAFERVGNLKLQLRPGSATGYKGVHDLRRGKLRFQARICENKKVYPLGVFESAEEAAIARAVHIAAGLPPSSPKHPRAKRRSVVKVDQEQRDPHGQGLEQQGSSAFECMVPMALACACACPNTSLPVAWARPLVHMGGSSAARTAQLAACAVQRSHTERGGLGADVGVRLILQD